FKTLELDEYLDVLSEVLKVVPPNVTVHRLTGDGPKKDLIAPLWSANKKMVLNLINKL
ncbi:MAG: TIGR01212 family radical SAM protein, partial [Clostridia bacterium]|nr:TIGR01212 family radical SAM protein [Clostridia bacterium]